MQGPVPDETGPCVIDHPCYSLVLLRLCATRIKQLSRGNIGLVARQGQNPTCVRGAAVCRVNAVAVVRGGTGPGPNRGEPKALHRQAEQASPARSDEFLPNRKALTGQHRVDHCARHPLACLGRDGQRNSADKHGQGRSQGVQGLSAALVHSARGSHKKGTYLFERCRPVIRRRGEARAILAPRLRCPARRLRCPGHRSTTPKPATLSRLSARRHCSTFNWRPGEPHTALRNHGYLEEHHGQAPPIV
jgi:hypothetical protein